MSRFLLTGGFVGFLLTFLGSFGAGRDINVAVRDAMLGCLAVSFAFRILYGQIENGVREILRREQAEADKEAREEALHEER